MTTPELLGRHLRHWRTARKATMRLVAEAVGVSEATVSGWETAKRFPSGAHLDAISRHTGIPLRCLFCPDTEGCAKYTAYRA